MKRSAGLLIAWLALCPAALAATAGQTQEELRELRARISALQKKLATAEESRSEASDALRESEKAISEANRELRGLAVQSREADARLAALRKSADAATTTMRGQQALLGRLLRQQYVQGEPDALRLVLSREDPNAMARQLHYLAHVARARARLVDGLRENLREFE
ncbi:MAG: protease, partial [Burkholderiales bacterium]|nr:protease [Burkholderiales bacterium]